MSVSVQVCVKVYVCLYVRTEIQKFVDAHLVVWVLSIQTPVLMILRQLLLTSEANLVFYYSQTVCILFIGVLKPFPFKIIIEKYLLIPDLFFFVCLRQDSL